MKSRKNGSASIPTKEMRGRRHVKILKGWKSGEVRETGGKGIARGRREMWRCTDDAAKMGKVLKEGWKRESGNGDATMPVGSFRLNFFHSFYTCFFSLVSPGALQLHDRRLKSCRVTLNVITLVSSSLYPSLQANSR